MGRDVYIDIAKGICLLTIVMGHIGVPSLGGLHVVMVPFFFFVSGYYFDNSASKLDVNGIPYSNWGGYILQKINRLLIPFILYYLLSYLFYYILDKLFPQALGNVDFSVFDLFTQRQLFNGPLWFFLALFFAEIIFYQIVRIKKPLMQCLVSCLLCFFGFQFGRHHIFVPLWIDSAFVAIGFMYIGFICHRYSVLELPWMKSWFYIIAAVVLYGFYLLWPCSLSMSENRYSQPFIHTIPIVTCLIFSLLFVCKPLKKEYVFTWISRNSMVIFCTHHLIYRPIKYFCDNAVIVLILTLIVEIPVVLIINKWLPVFAGKCNLIKSRCQK